LSHQSNELLREIKNLTTKNGLVKSKNLLYPETWKIMINTSYILNRLTTTNLPVYLFVV